MVAPTKDPEPHRRPLTVDELMRMCAAGIISEDERVELIEGELIAMTPPNAPHNGIINRLTRLLVYAVGSRGVVSVQNSVRLSDITLPLPDFTVLRAKEDDYVSRLPNSADIVLMVEVSDTSLSYDRNRKAALYALHGVPEYWIVDVNNEKLIRLREPTSSGYRKIDEPTGVIAPKLMAKCKIDLGELFPG